VISKRTKLLLAIPILLIVLVVSFFVVALDEKLSCHVDNIVRGHLWSGDFTRAAVISDNGSSKRIDLTGIEKLEKICIIEMYTYGEPYSSKELDEVIYRKNSPRACWRYSRGGLTILGIYPDKSIEWTQVTIGRQEIRYAAPECVDRRQAILLCRDNVCSFAR